MTSEETTWAEVNRVYNEKRLDLLKRLSDLDEWYGEQQFVHSTSPLDQID